MALHGNTPAIRRARCGGARAGCRGECGELGHGVHDATRDPAVLARMAAIAPGANVGVATGEQHGIFVLDIDKRSGGLQSWAKLVAIHGEPSATFTVRSGGGGLHLYWKYPSDGRRVRSRSPGVPHVPGVDIKGDGGMVTGPGSIHKSGGLYEIVDDAPVAEAPGWVLDLYAEIERRVEPPGVAPYAPGAPPVDVDSAMPPGLAEAAAAAVRVKVAAARSIIRGAGRGSRHKRMLRAAVLLGGIVGAGCLDRDWCLDTLADDAVAVGKPLDEALRTVSWGLDTGMGRPWIITGRSGGATGEDTPPEPAAYSPAPAGATVTRYRAQWCAPLPRGDGVVAVRAPWGTGKSRAIGEAVRDEERVLVVTPRRLLAEKAAREWKLADYQEVHGALPPRVAVCLDSIHRVAPAYADGATLVIDEAGLLGEHGTGNTFRADRYDVLVKLRGLARRARRVLVADAALTAESLLVTLGLLGIEDMPVAWVENAAPAPFPSAGVIEGSRGAMLVELWRLVEEGKKVAVPVTSRIQAQAIADEAQRRFPGKAVEIVTGDDPPARSLSDIAASADIFIFSPLVGVGESIEVPFDAVVACLVSIRGMTADSAVQALFRVRHPGRLLVWIDPRDQHAGPERAKDVKKALERARNFAQQRAGGPRPSNRARAESDALVSAWTGLVAYRNGRCRSMRTTILAELASRGVRAESVLVDEEEARAAFRSSKAAKARVKIREAIKVVAAPRLSREEAARLSRAYAPTKETRRAVYRREIVDFYGDGTEDPVAPGLVVFDDHRRGRSAVRLLVDIRAVREENWGAVLARDPAAMEGNLLQAKGSALKAHLFSRALGAAGLDGDPSTWGGKEVACPREFTGFMKANAVAFGEFGVTVAKDIDERPQSVLAKLLRACGLKKVAVTHRKNRRYVITPESVDTMMAYSKAEYARAMDRGAKLLAALRHEGRELQVIAPPPPPSRKPEPTGGAPPGA